MHTCDVIDKSKKKMRQYTYRYRLEIKRLSVAATMAGSGIVVHLLMLLEITR